MESTWKSGISRDPLLYLRPNPFFLGIVRMLLEEQQVGLIFVRDYRFFFLAFTYYAIVVRFAWVLVCRDVRTHSFIASACCQQSNVNLFIWPHCCVQLAIFFQLLHVWYNMYAYSNGLWRFCF